MVDRSATIVEPVRYTLGGGGGGGVIYPGWTSVILFCCSVSSCDLAEEVERIPYPVRSGLLLGVERCCVL